MKSAAEALAKQTTYEKSEEEEKEGSSGNANRSYDMHPNDVGLSLFDNDIERLIDGDYRIMEGYTQQTERAHEYSIDLGNIRHNQIISARISDQSSLLATDADGEHI